jgi:hypothetical protein
MVRHLAPELVTSTQNLDRAWSGLHHISSKTDDHLARGRDVDTMRTQEWKRLAVLLL